MAVKCKICNSDNTNTAKFCSECASPLQPDKDIGITKTIKTPVEEFTWGTLFADRYEIIDELGKGGMGAVYKAKDTRLDRTVALKFLPQSFITDDEAKERFVREAKAAASLNHPNITVIHEIDKDLTFIAMEYIDGQSLKDKIKSGPMSTDEIVDIIKQIAKGLEEAHNKRIVHRDSQYYVDRDRTSQDC